MTPEKMRSMADLAVVENRENPYPNPNFPPSIYYKFFEILTAETKPNLSVELGINGGGGSLHLAKGWPQGTVIGVDIAWDCQENIKHIEENYSNFKFCLSDSIGVSSYIYDKYGAIDILFIDFFRQFEAPGADGEDGDPFCLELGFNDITDTLSNFVDGGNDCFRNIDEIIEIILGQVLPEE